MPPMSRNTCSAGLRLWFRDASQLVAMALISHAQTANRRSAGFRRWLFRATRSAARDPNHQIFDTLFSVHALVSTIGLPQS
jgi:hypothetical protein